MQPLPMALSSCSLDQASLGEQLARYRAVGEGAVWESRGDTSIALSLSDGVSDDLVRELIAVENRCCPFFALDWDPARRRLAVAIQAPEHARALEAIVLALGAGAAPEAVENPLHR
jgi:hypothetical protein